MRATEAAPPVRQRTGEPLLSLLTDRWLAVALLIALALRLLVGWLAPHPGWLGDEREYFSAATILADGRGFAFSDQSIWVRPPLYVAMVALLFRLFGPAATPVWIAQLLLSLLTIVLTYLLGRLWFTARLPARIAAFLCALYLPFAVFAGLLLSETLFTTLIVLAFVALAWHSARGGWLALIIAGGALGAAVLARGLALPFLAAVPLWALARDTGPRDRRAALLRSALVIGVALALIAPWTARNAHAYGRLIPVDTTGGYNFWLGALGGRDAAKIDAVLREVPNQGDRQAVAWARGWEVVRAEPLAYGAKALKEAGDLWRINFGAFERLLRGYGLGKIPAPWLLLTALLDDGLYLLALPLAPLGWIGLRGRGNRWLLGLWLGWNIAAAALFFAITRFRLPLMPVLLLLSANGALRLPALTRSLLHHQWRLPRQWYLPAAVSLLAIALVWPTFEPDQYLIGIDRASANRTLERGYAALARDDTATALRDFTRLPADFYARPTALAATYHAQGQDDRALAALDDGIDPIGATLLRGDIFRARGQTAAAIEALNYRDVRIANPTGEAWSHLFPPPLSRLDVGNGLDLGYLLDCNLDERDPDGATYRWTTGASSFRLAPPNSNSAILRVRLRSYRPLGALPAVAVAVNGQPVGTIRPGTTWQVYDLPVNARAPLVVTITTRPFVPGYDDQRELGVMVDWLELISATGAAR